MAKQYQMYINGEWVEAVSGKAFDDYDPSTGKVFARIPAGGREDVKRAIDVVGLPLRSSSLKCAA